MDFIRQATIEKCDRNISYAKAMISGTSNMSKNEKEYWTGQIDAYKDIKKHLEI
tara:strand:+ start:84 stop:245 length:162 start_codon:yes stop_codon:yes gene_type:complete